MGHGLDIAVNCSILFPDVPLLQRAGVARAAGFDAVEFWWPFQVAVPNDAEVDSFTRSIADAGVRLVSLNFFAGDMPNGDRGLISWPGRSSQLRDNVEATIEIGANLGCRAFNALYGNRIEDESPEKQDEIAADNLAFAASTAARIDGVVLVEPISGSARYPVQKIADAVAVIDRVEAGSGAKNLRVLADLYHLAVNGEDLPDAAVDEVHRIGHVQVADAPGRLAPGVGELPLDPWLWALEAAGYCGAVGLEHLPGPGDEDGFRWALGRATNARQSETTDKGAAQ